MTTALAQQPITKPVILYSVTPETIATMAEKFAALKINGTDDKAGYELVHKARMECVKARSQIEKTRKELKAESLEFGRKVDSEAKLLTGKIEAIEYGLAEQQKIVDDAKEAIRLKAEDAKVAERIRQLEQYPETIRSDAVLRSMSDAQFSDYLAGAVKADDARKSREAERLERERIAAEQAEANRIEQERLKAERAAFEAQQKAAKAEADRVAKIEADKRAAEQAELDRQRAEIKAEQDRLAAIELDRIEAEQAAKRLAQAKADAEAKAVRDEELKPVRQRLEEFAAKVQLLALPDVADGVAGSVQHVLDVAANDIRNIAKGLK